MTNLKHILAIMLTLATMNAIADIATAERLSNKYATIAKNINPESKGLSVEDGKTFFNREITIKGRQVACASCHTANPAELGKHIMTEKPIRPLSPIVNQKRFSDIDKVESNFTRHCNDIIGRDCTAQEKGNFIAYLLSIK